MSEESKDWQKERGGRIDTFKSPDSPMSDDERVDQAIAESFPASDPPSFNSGIDDEEEERPADSDEAGSTRR
jgi:hypothetical protein